MSRSTTFLLGLALWILLVWPFPPGPELVRAPDLVAGVVVALVAALVMGRSRGTSSGVRFHLSRVGWAIAYVFAFVWAVLQANFDVAYRVLHPALPIKPGIVRIRTTLKTIRARVVLANSITLTPGTLSVDIADDGTLFVHWICVASEDAEEAKRRIFGRLESILRRVLE
jgi:multicomponent Na+:H+ antiporter subunit E